MSQQQSSPFLVRSILSPLATHVATITHSAVLGLRSRAWLYPIRGIIYFARHPGLWTPLARNLLPTLALSIGITTALFFTTYVPQAALLTLVNGPLAILTTITLVLTESACITATVARSLFLTPPLLQTFDQTLALTAPHHFAQGRGGAVMPPTPAADSPRVRRGLRRHALRCLLLLPLNAVPLLGPAIALVVQGRKVGPGAHARWFDMKGWGRGQREKWVGDRREAYTAFGVVAALLEGVPFVGLVAGFTNAVGAAMWVGDLEKGMVKRRVIEEPKNGEEHEMDDLGRKKEL